jgi:rhamnosyltransferase
MLVSVIIPVKNGARTLHQCLSSVKTQTIANDLEVVVLDSGSTDNSKQIALGFGAKVIDILPGEFNHGLTRNEGVRYATGELIYYTVQDASIADNDMLERMSVHFNDKEVQSVCAHQGVPHELDKNPAIWFRRMTEPEIEVRYFPDKTFTQLSREQQLSYSAWDNVCAMYRKEALIKLPFQETNFSEDCLWADMALKNGYKIIRDPSLVVYHYHHQTFRYAYKTSFIINYYFFKVFAVLPSFPKLVMPFLVRTNILRKEKRLNAIHKLYWILHNGAALLAQWLSVVTFKITYLFFGKAGLDRSYRVICKTVPQGRHRS